MLFAAGIVAALTCDESCDERSTAWRDDPGAWQWDAQLVLAVAAAGTMLAGALLMSRSDRGSAAGIFAAGVVAALAWAAWML